VVYMPESSSERVLTARRYPKLGDQRFESMPKVCLADRSASMRMPTADHNHCLWTVAATMMS
jgi:hypothetical protein